MLPGAKSTKRLLYVSNYGAAVLVYDYEDLKLVRTLTGFAASDAECVDARGDVWIINNSGGSQGPGYLSEYAHGGESPLKTLGTAELSTSCSVAPNGDLAVTNAEFYKQGSVQVWKSASGTPTDYTVPEACGNELSAGGYDNKDNLYIQGDDEGLKPFCELPKNGRSIRTVSVSQAVYDPQGVMWDGKYLAITDTEYGGNYATAILQTTEDSSGDLTVVGTTVLNDNCYYKNDVGVLRPFIVGKKNTPVNDTQGTALIGFNQFCSAKSDEHPFELWPYPSGGNSIKTVGIPSGTGEAVSIGR
jgi:hypothetical protein